MLAGLAARVLTNGLKNPEEAVQKPVLNRRWFGVV